MYWAVALSYKVFGFNEFATRCRWRSERCCWSRRSIISGAGWAARGRASIRGWRCVRGLGVYLFTRIMIPEVIIAFFLTVAFYFFLKVYLGELDTRWVYAFYACMAAAVLTKGLIGLVFPCGALFVFVLMRKAGGSCGRCARSQARFCSWPSPSPGMLAIWRNEKFFWFYFINEHFLRFLGKRYLADYDTVPIASFWLLHLVWLFPFSVFLPSGSGSADATCGGPRNAKISCGSSPCCGRWW